MKISIKRIPFMTYPYDMALMFRMLDEYGLVEYSGVPIFNRDAFSTSTWTGYIEWQAHSCLTS